MRNRSSNADTYNKFALYLSLVMFPIYFGVGVFIIVAPEYFKDFNTFIRVVLGGLFIAYAISRCYRTIKKLKIQKLKDDDISQEEPQNIG
jgi:hypothetical protein